MARLYQVAAASTGRSGPSIAVPWPPLVLAPPPSDLQLAAQDGGEGVVPSWREVAPSSLCARCVLHLLYFQKKKKKKGASSVDRWLIKVKKDSEKHFRRTWEQLALMFSVSRVLEAILFGHRSPECLEGCQGVET